MVKKTKDLLFDDSTLTDVVKRFGDMDAVNTGAKNLKYELAEYLFIGFNEVKTLKVPEFGMLHKILLIN